MDAWASYLSDDPASGAAAMTKDSKFGLLNLEQVDLEPGAQNASNEFLFFENEQIFPPKSKGSTKRKMGKRFKESLRSLAVRKGITEPTKENIKPQINTSAQTTQYRAGGNCLFGTLEQSISRAKQHLKLMANGTQRLQKTV